MYRMARQYRDILDRVTYEYAVIPSGEHVGGASKADGTHLTFSNVPWEHKFAEEDVSCCDCLNISAQGSKLGRPAAV